MAISKITMVAALVGALGLSACTDPSQLNSGGTSKTENGALIGGLIGAGVGALASDSAGGVIGTAAAGALVGGLIGNELEKQEAELRQTLANDQISIVNTGDRLIVTLPNDLTFATDSAQVSPAARGDLLKVADSLVRYPNSLVRVIGHADSDGEALHNLNLSNRRANAVADLIQAGGVPFNRINTVGRGEDEPIASNLTPEGKARNRRVEIIVIPST
ncbi:OmpA family protein [Epibacterium ulvae]|uniref:Outer membrane protein OmpA n=1 Tax=Epibacterium ulvae TaxID=1156985 RepID=A0A1G5R6U7_9RHOB|nr:OmpA family protein [Epibacterium ulvae]SCZ69510.1 Outer membrane protein OmpA [Epibacterium ulvae]